MWMVVNVIPSERVSDAATSVNAVEGRLAGDVGGEPRRRALDPGAADVDDVPEPPLAHLREEGEDQPDRAEVVDGHGPLEIVQPVRGVVEAPPDRPAGVVDEHVDVIVLGENGFDGVLDRLLVGDVAGVPVGVAARRTDLGHHGVEFLGAPGEENDLRALAGRRDRGTPADSGRRPGDHHVPAHERSGRVGPARSIRVEVLTPVRPQPVGVRREPGDVDACAAQRLPGVVVHEHRGQRHVLDEHGRDAESAEHHLAARVEGRVGGGSEEGADESAGESGRGMRCTGGLGERGVDLADRLGARIDEMERLAVPSRCRHQLHDGRGHVVDGDDVGRADPGTATGRAAGSFASAAMAGKR